MKIWPMVVLEDIIGTTQLKDWAASPAHQEKMQWVHLKLNKLVI
jgi:hypothetical protein